MDALGSRGDALGSRGNALGSRLAANLAIVLGVC